MKDKMPDWAKQEIDDAKSSRKAEKAYNDAMVNTPPAPKKKKEDLDKPIPRGGMVRSGGKLVPRFARDMGMDEPIPFRGMDNRGQGLETVPDEGFAKGGKVKKYAKGGSVKGYGMARGGKKCKIC